MSHSLSIGAGAQMFPVQLTITDYTTGGESVLPSELGASSITGVLFGSVPPGANSLGAVLFPVLAGGKVMLFRFVSGAPVEIPTTAGVNAVVPTLVYLVRNPLVNALYP